MAAGRGYDVVVVGAGSAGCVVARRLAEHGGPSVLLLEAGPDLRADPALGLRDGWGIDRQTLDWGYTALPDTFHGVRNVWRKRLVGGTSWLTRFSLRGCRADYDGWAARGNTGWGYDEVLPYFVGLETDAEYGGEAWHGDAGPMPTTRYPDLDRSGALEASVDAALAAGFPAADDHNAPSAVGVGPMPMSSRNGVRVTTADAYLPVGGTPATLTIRPNAVVASLVVEGDHARAVRLLDGSEVECGRVVLCAGTYGSPAVLLRSGIGPADDLRRTGLAVVAELPGVGANLTDHPGFSVDAGAVAEGRSAPLLHAVATFHSAGRAADETPDLMLWLADPEEPGPFEIEAVLLRPLSRGSVRLASPDPAAAPVISLPALDERDDVRRLAEAYERAVEVANGTAFRRRCDGPGPVLPDISGRLRQVQAGAYSIPHVVGTCAMGPVPEAGAVVDPSGRVHGITNVWVADASVMPDVPSGFTHIPTIMIAERVAAHVAASSDG